MAPKKYHLVAAGELLADLIGCEFTTDLYDTAEFRRVQGGSPANLAANMARLGHSTALVACVGQDSLGKYLIEQVAQTGIHTDFIASDERHPSSIVLVSRTKGTPDFIAYRTADCQLLPYHFPDHLLTEAAVFHTTCFALSREPARSSLLDAATRARAAGARVSLDANYAPSIWPDRLEAQQVVAAYAPGALIKLSDDDAARLLGRAVSEQEVLDFFFGHGAYLVCYTLGAAGSVVAWDGGQQRIHRAVEPVEVKDATGAGDAYWSGFLTALLEGNSPEACAKAGARMAAQKLQVVGPLPNKVDRAILYA